jgi:uncharacterized protein YdaT
MSAILYCFKNLETMENRNEIEDAAAMKKEWQRRHELSGDTDKQNEWHDHTETEKYLGMEQHGVSFTQESHPTMNSDYLETDNMEHERWRTSGNSRNADAFSQDDYILRDNLDLDEDQNASISSDDADK